MQDALRLVLLQAPLAACARIDFTLCWILVKCTLRCDFLDRVAPEA